MSDPSPPPLLQPPAPRKREWRAVAAGAATAVVLGIVWLFLLSRPRFSRAIGTPLALVVSSAPVATILLLIPKRTRMFALGMLLAVGAALLICLAICGGALLHSLK